MKTVTGRPHMVSVFPQPSAPAPGSHSFPLLQVECSPNRMTWNGGCRAAPADFTSQPLYCTSPSLCKHITRRDPLYATLPPPNRRPISPVCSADLLGFLRRFWGGGGGGGVVYVVTPRSGLSPEGEWTQGVPDPKHTTARTSDGGGPSKAVPACPTLAAAHTAEVFSKSGRMFATPTVRQAAADLVRWNKGGRDLDLDPSH